MRQASGDRKWEKIRDGFTGATELAECPRMREKKTTGPVLREHYHTEQSNL